MAAGSDPDVMAVRLIHDRTGALKVVPELAVCHSVCDSGLWGACANSAVVGFTCMTVVKSTLGPDDPE